MGIGEWGRIHGEINIYILKICIIIYVFKITNNSYKFYFVCLDRQSEDNNQPYPILFTIFYILKLFNIHREPSTLRVTAMLPNVPMI